MKTDAVSDGPGRALLPTAFALLSACLLVAGVQALMVPLSDGDLATGADEIVRGTITDVRSQWSGNGTSIETVATVRVDQKIKGKPPGTLTVTALGGTVDGITQWVEDEPDLVPGTEAFLFVKRSPRWGTVVHGARQGLVPVRQGRV